MYKGEGMPDKQKKNELREKAEEKISGGKMEGKEFSGGDLQHLIEELQIHQVELEMQNEELRKAQEEIEKSRSRYSHLYESLPAGYFTLDQYGLIKDLNWAGAELLGHDKSFLIGLPFRRFVAPEFREAFDRHLIINPGAVEKQTVDLKLVKADQSLRYVIMESQAAFYEKEPEMEILAVVLDMTERKMMEQVIADSEERLRDLSARLLRTQETERKKIAGDIHDSLGSDLSAAKFKLERVLEDVDSKGLGKKGLREAIASIETCIREVRRIQSDLRPSVLDDLGIGPAINWFCREFTKNFSIPVDKIVEIEEDRIPLALKAVVFRTVQEALHNVAKHSRSDRALVSLTMNDNLLNLAVKDYGRGFDYAKLLEFPKGIGLSSMKERVHISGGDFK